MNDQTPVTAGVRRGPPDFWWAVHNIIAHPLSEIFYWLGLQNLSNYIHEQTLPIHDPSESGRG